MRRDWQYARAKLEREGVCRWAPLGGCEGKLQICHTAGRVYDPPIPGRPGWLWVPAKLTVPGCATHHRAYDDGDLDLLPFLRRDEEVAIVEAMGISRALIRLTGYRVVEHYRQVIAAGLAANVENDTEDLIPF